MSKIRRFLTRCLIAAVTVVTAPIGVVAILLASALSMLNEVVEEDR